VCQGCGLGCVLGVFWVRFGVFFVCQGCVKGVLGCIKGVSVYAKGLDGLKVCQRCELGVFLVCLGAC